MVLGIDLGTCNTLCATLSRDGYPVLIPDAYSNLTTMPSMVFIDEDMAIAGTAAEQHLELKPDKNTIRFFKRNFGTTQPVYFDRTGKPWFSETVAAIMLKKVKQNAEMFSPDPVEGVVITVPAHYNDNQRKSVIEAAKLAGLPLQFILDEPVAGALHYLMEARNDNEIVLVYDYGGGTFDLTLLTKMGREVHTLAKDGLSAFGGKELDELIANRIMETYERLFREAFPFDVYNSNKLMRDAEQIKLQLSMQMNKRLSKWLYYGQQAFEFSINPAEFSNLIRQSLQRIDQVITGCLRSVGISQTDVNKVVLIGGSSQFPQVEAFWKERLGAHQQLITHNPMQSVAMGAALYAGSLMPGYASRSGQLELKNASSYNLALSYQDFRAPDDVLLLKNSPLPISVRRSFQVPPNGKIDYGLVQYWDPSQLFPMGRIIIGPLSSKGYTQVDFVLENRSNGTIAIKVTEANSDKPVKFQFVKEQSEFSYDFEEQKKQLDKLLVL